MHYNDNPFAPQIDTPPNVLIHDNPSAVIEYAINANPSIVVLPEGCTFGEISLKDNREELINFINRNHGNDTWKHCVTNDEIDYLIEANNARFYGVRWNGLLVACMSMEIFNVKIYDKTYRSAFVDYGTIHPRFRKKGLYNVMTSIIYQETVKHGCIIEFFTGHTKLSFKPCVVKPSYAYSLTNMPYTSGLMDTPSRPTFTIRNKSIKTPTIEDLKRFNDRKDFDVYLTYDDILLSAMLKYYKIYTNGKSLLCFVPVTNIINNFTVKCAILRDWVNVSCEFFKECAEELRKDGFDLISFTNDGELKELTLNIPFEKKEDVYYYTMNILPKTKKGRINLTVR